MYYAPWDAGSIHAKEEFETVARFYHTEIFFAAINCWWPEGECHKVYKFLSYPVIIVNVQHLGNIKYQGPMVANYIISFLDHVLTPFVHIQNQGDLLDLQSKYEAVLVGFFDFETSTEPTGYLNYYEAALKGLSQDPTRRLMFAISTSKKTAIKLKLGESSSLTLYLWNQTEVYPNTEFKTNEILKWAFSRLHQVTTWLTPPGTKSSLLSQIIEKSPTLLLFTPRNQMAGLSPYYDLFRETALEFYNCNSSVSVTTLIQHLILKRYALQQELIYLKEKCASYIASVQEYKNCKNCNQQCCQFIESTQFSLNKCTCLACLYSIEQKDKKSSKSNCDKMISKVIKHMKFPSYLLFHSCSNIDFKYPLNYGSYHHMSVNCHAGNTKDEFSSDLYHTSKSMGVQDDRVVKLLQIMEKKKCRHFYVAMNYSQVNFPNVSQVMSPNWKNNFSGLGCRTNRTLAFAAMDAIEFHTFAEHLGFDILNHPHQTIVVILEAKQETQYHLEGEINKSTLADFIVNYTENLLNRHLRSAVKYKIGCDIATGSDSVCVHEVTTDQFQNVVLDPQKDVVVMYYAPWCAFCGSIAHVFLTVARYFTGISGILFVRINGDDNDLPWEFTVDKYPSILFFPAKRKPHSVKFPHILPITPVNLLHFVLMNAQPEIRWKISLQLCNKRCIIHNYVKTSSKIPHLFRELHLLLNHFHFVQENLYKARKMRIFPIGKRSKNLFKEDKYQLQEDILIDYHQWLVKNIREKKKKIKWARKLQSLLREKGSLQIAKKLIFLENDTSTFNNIKFDDDQLRATKVRDEL